jgi:hypothetical protein
MYPHRIAHCCGRIPKTIALATAGLWLSLAPCAPALEAVGVLGRVDQAQRTLHLNAGGQDRVIRVADDVRVLDAAGQPLAGGLAAAELAAGARVTVTVDRIGQERVVRSIRLGGEAPQPRERAGRGGRQAQGGAPSVGFKPLCDMTADDRYKGEDGGLYGGGRNAPPPELAGAAERQTLRIVPLDADGKPSTDGKIGLVSISMSNATQEFSHFKQLADADPRKSPRVAIVDCAQGGQAMAEWVSPTARPWAEANRRLQAAGVSPAQVQVVWVKLANKSPRGELAVHGKKLEQDTLAVLRNAKARFPNLRIAYLASRIYGGYSGGSLNPEPYAYEGAFAARWLIQDQLRGAAGLAWDDSKGEAQVPLLLWGPYFWADGEKPRASDGLVWLREDLGPDGTHPSPSGREKVARMLLEFLAKDPWAATWFATRRG